MNLDGQTLLLTIALLELVGAVLLLIYWKLSKDSENGNRLSLLVWSGAFALGGAGTLLLALRGIVPEFASIVLGNTFLIAGAGLRLNAVRVFWTKTPLYWTTGLTVGLWLVLCAVPALYENYAFRGLVVITYFAAIAPAIAFAAIRYNRERLLTPSLLGMSHLIDFLLHAAMLASLVLSQHSDFLGVMANHYYKIYLLGLLGTGMASISLSFAMVIERDEKRHFHAARRDSLTGLYNRGAFFDLGEASLARGTARAMPYSVVLLDLDGFKQINDRHGHAAGDAILQSFARTCREHLRKHDIIGRVGGEEFALILEDTTPDIALNIADRLRTAFSANALSDSNGLVSATLSAGVASGLAGEQDLDKAIATADQGLYAAKHNGRNRVYFGGRRPQPPEGGNSPSAAA